MRGSFLYNNDVPGQYPAQSYYTASAQFLSTFPTLQGEQAADVGIIGAGYTGLSAALHLAQAGYQVIVLDAHRVGWGASGRNGGQVGSGLNKDQYELEKRFGQTQAHALWDLSQEAVQLCKQLIATHRIPCDLQAGIIHTSHRSTAIKYYQAYAEKMQRDYACSDFQPLDQAAIRQKIASSAYCAGILNTASAHLHPLNYALGLARAAQQAGAMFYENSPVLSYETAPTIKLKLANGSVGVKHLLIACNGYLDRLEPRIAARVMPINNYIVATEPLADDLAHTLIRERQAVADARFVVNYFRLSADNRLLFGGGESYSFRFPDDLRAVVRPRLLQVFPQLSKVKLDYAWGGTLAITRNRLPNFTQLAPNILAAGGYSGHGIALATLAGKLMSEVVRGQQERFDVMARLPKPIFPGGVWLRWPLLVTAMLYYSLRDRL